MHAAVRDQYQSDENGGTEWYRVPFQLQANFITLVLRGVQVANATILATNIR